MWDDPTTFPYLIPIIWQGNGPNPSPNYPGRVSLYSVGGIPHCQWGGNQHYIGGGTGTLPGYISLYNAIVAMDSPAEIDVSLNTNDQGQLVIQADVELTGNITTTNNKIIFILTHDFDPGQLPDHFCSAITYDEQDFDLTTTGQTGFYESSAITLNPAWELVKIKAIAIIQTLSGDHIIHQAAITEYSGLLPMFTSNLTEGPAYLGVQFTSTSLPLTGIESWEWDFDGDGVFDSTEENPYYLFTDPGSYNVTLRIGMGGEYEEITVPDYINVTDGSNVSGDLSGVWVTDFSPYQITDDVSIPSGAELIIEPDVQIITNNNSKIKVEGKIVADASGKAPIIFTSNDSWKGIQFFNTMEDNLIQNCEITNATYCAVDIENSKVDIIENTIYENSTTTQKGAAINVIGLESVYIYKNLIANNTSSILCAGIVCDNANPLVSHNIIVNNTAGLAGAISLKNSSNPIMINNTIANNESTYDYGAMWFASSSATVNNCILIDALDVFTLFGSTVNVTYTCMSGGYSGTGNIDGDPMFENPTAGSGTSYNGLEANWSLLEESPCIDTGDPNTPLDPDGSRADMGALYFNHIAVDPQIQNGGISLNNYPNPFNFQTNISYNIKPNRNSKIIIYNIKGNIVKEFNSLPFEGNYGEIVWDGTDTNGNAVSNGVYFYQIEAKNLKSEIKKMIILR